MKLYINDGTLKELKTYCKDRTGISLNISDKQTIKTFEKRINRDIELLEENYNAVVLDILRKLKKEYMAQLEVETKYNDISKDVLIFKR